MKTISDSELSRMSKAQIVLRELRRASPSPKGTQILALWSAGYLQAAAELVESGMADRVEAPKGVYKVTPTVVLRLTDAGRREIASGLAA